MAHLFRDFFLAEYGMFPCEELLTLCILRVGTTILSTAQLLENWFSREVSFGRFQSKCSSLSVA